MREEDTEDGNAGMAEGLVLWSSAMDSGGGKEWEARADVSDSTGIGEREDGQGGSTT